MAGSKSVWRNEESVAKKDIPQGNPSKVNSYVGIQIPQCLFCTVLLKKFLIKSTFFHHLRFNLYDILNGRFFVCIFQHFKYFFCVISHFIKFLF